MSFLSPAAPPDPPPAPPTPTRDAVAVQEAATRERRRRVAQRGRASTILRVIGDEEPTTASVALLGSNSNV